MAIVLDAIEALDRGLPIGEVAVTLHPILPEPEDRANDPLLGARDVIFYLLGNVRSALVATGNDVPRWVAGGRDVVAELRRIVAEEQVDPS